jgi:MFS family permease
MAMGTVLFGLAPVFGVAVAGRFLIGLGASVILIAWLSLAAACYEPQRFATISGWTQTVGNWLTGAIPGRDVDGPRVRRRADLFRSGLSGGIRRMFGIWRAATHPGE